MGRIDKENYYLDIAQTVAGRSTCLRRCYGAILVKSDEIISTGYNGAAPSTPRPTPSSPPPAARPWAPPSTWPAWSRTPGR